MGRCTCLVLLVVAHGAVADDFNDAKAEYLKHMIARDEHEEPLKASSEDMEEQAQLLNKFIAGAPAIRKQRSGNQRYNFPTMAPTHHEHHHRHRWYKRHHKKDPYTKERIAEGRRGKHDEDDAFKGVSKEATDTLKRAEKKQEAANYIEDKKKGCTLTKHKYHICTTVFKGCCLTNSCTTECPTATKRGDFHKLLLKRAMDLKAKKKASQVEEPLPP
jgi:hypothetical protein